MFDRDATTMMRKLLRRFLVASVLFAGFVILCVVTTALLVMQTPGFYSERLNATSSAEKQAAAKSHWEQTVRTHKQWLANSISRQRTQVFEKDPRKKRYEPSEDIHIVRITEEDINTLISSSQTRSQGAISEPRFQFRDGEAAVAFQLKSSRFHCVVSSVLRPKFTDDGRLQLDILSARIGQLPIPLETLIRCSPKELRHQDGTLEIDLTLPTPHIALNLWKHQTHIAPPKSVHCLDGEIVIQFVAPKLHSKQTTTHVVQSL